MAKYKYRNTSDSELVIPNVGVVKAGQEISSETPIDNPNLEVVSLSMERREEASKKTK